MYSSLQVTHQDFIQTVKLNRPQERNSLDTVLIKELLQALEEAECNSHNRIVILKGHPGFFCIGMDFKEAIDKDRPFESKVYLNLLRRLTTLPRIIISVVEGTVMAGGIGLIAASDIVIATPESQFSLPEILWGLIPCCVAPYLIRRMGFQAAYRLTLTAQALNGDEAQRLQLVDILTSNPEEEIRKHCLRFKRLHPETLQDMKRYFYKMWIINEAMEETAIREITRLTQLPRVQHNLANYVQKQKLPWEEDV